MARLKKSARYRPLDIFVARVVPRRSIWIKEPPVISAAAVAKVATEFIDDPDVEWFLALYVDPNYRLSGLHPVGIGSIHEVEVEPRKIFAPALQYPTAGIYLCHNHVSGDLRPTTQDLQTTQKMLQAADLLAMTILDHIVLGPGRRYMSFKHEGFLMTQAPVD